MTSLCVFHWLITGAVGLPLQIHDTSITFVTCHLPSDSKGKSKLSKRNASAHAVLKGLILAPEDVGFDLHLQHDHVMVFGGTLIRYSGLTLQFFESAVLH